MNKLVEVKEFETIIGNKVFADKYKCLDEEVFKSLLLFIHEYQTNDTETDILDFVKIGYKRNIGEIIIFKNYVGLIQLPHGYQIQILPKIPFRNGEKDQTQKVFLKMLRCLKDFEGKSFSRADIRSDRMNLYELFINMYLQEVRRLVKHGIQSTYIRTEKNLPIYKGKLLVKEHLKRNLSHKERFYVTYDEYQVNRPENKLIKSSLLKLQNVTTSYENAKEIRQLLSYFELVKPSINYDSDFAKVVKDRNGKHYDQIIQWSRVFLKNNSFSPFSGKESGSALLFPMETVFEAYVAKNLKRIFKRNGWTVSTQDKGHYLFTSLNGNPLKKFALRPDIVVTREDRKLIIMDVKWKKLINNPGRNYGISQTDMYQMYAYAKKYNASEVWLLYPQSEELIGVDPITFDSGDGVVVNVVLLECADIGGTLAKIENVILNTI